MNKTRGTLITVSAIALVWCVVSMCVPQSRGRRCPEGNWCCPPLPETFEESDLIGTWQAKYGASTDTLILREDGTYEQLYVCGVCNDRHGYSFENSGDQWWLERRPSGGLYLHLKGMRRCDQIDELCYQESGGGGDWAYLDFCEDRYVRMPDEVVIMVTGVPRGGGSAPRGIWLWHMGPSRGSSAFHFTLQEE